MKLTVAHIYLGNASGFRVVKIGQAMAVFCSIQNRKYAHFYPNRPVDFSSIRDKPVLILLGEAGIGKSTAMFADAELVEQAAKENQHLYLSRNLNQYGDESRLIGFGEPNRRLARRQLG